jgi:hypothetical protein
MNPAQVAALLTKYGKVLGPKAAKAVAASAPGLFAKYQAQSQSGSVLDQVVAMRRSSGARIEAQIDLATATATDELQEQTLPERQDMCRTWVRALKVQRVALKATENQDRKIAKLRRDQVAQTTDAILAEIIETIGKWSTSP